MKINDKLTILIGGLTYEAKPHVELEEFVKSIFIDVFSERATKEFRIIWCDKSLFISNINIESLESIKSKIMELNK